MLAGALGGALLTKIDLWPALAAALAVVVVTGLAMRGRSRHDGPATCLGRGRGISPWTSGS